MSDRSAPEPPFDDSHLRGYADAIAACGEPRRLTAAEAAGLPGPSSRGDSSRRAEIVLVLPRPGGLLFHTKAFYPPGVFRLPTGGVHPGEAILDAARRELLEETGGTLSPLRFLFHIAHRPADLDRPVFHSLGFVFPSANDPVSSADESEQISEWREWPPERLGEIADALEALDAPWGTWGRFRAISHRLLARLWPEIALPHDRTFS